MDGRTLACTLAFRVGDFDARRRRKNLKFLSQARKRRRRPNLGSSRHLCRVVVVVVSKQVTSSFLQFWAMQESKIEKKFVVFNRLFSVPHFFLTPDQANICNSTTFH